MTNVSCETCIFDLITSSKQLSLQAKTNPDLNPFLIFFDLSKAFDSVDHNTIISLFEKNKHNFFTDKEINTIKLLFSSYRISTGNNNTIHFNKGIP